MTDVNNFNAIPTPTIAPYIDELVLSPAPENSANSSLSPTPELMISPTQPPLPSLGIYKTENGVNLVLTPTPQTLVKKSGGFNDFVLWGLMAFAVIIFICGVIYGLKNSSQKGT